MRIFVSFFLWIGALGVLSAALLGFGGSIHPVGDSFAAFRLHIGGGAVALWALSALLGRVWVERISGVGACLALGAIVWSAALPRPHVPPLSISVLQHNILYRNETPDAVIAQIVAAQADVVLLQEVVPTIADQIFNIPSYPSHRLCNPRSVSTNVILSRWPILQQGCAQWANWAQVDTPLGPVTFVSVHLRWPWPFEQPRDVEGLVPLLTSLPQPVVMGGDYNSAPWSSAVTRLGVAAQSVLVPGVRLTFADARFWPGLPIDHVHMPKGWVGQAQMLGLAGSDHRATFATVGPISR